jgi:flagellar hook-associated protein 3 FlgL
MRLQTKYADVNTQISSGLKSQDYKGIAKDSQYLLAIESSMDKLTTYNANANTTLATVNTMFSTMGRIEELANSMVGDLTAALGGNMVPSTVLQSQASNGMLEVASLLNFRVAGKYIFSGSDTDQQSVDLTDPAWTIQTPPSTANTSYYQGNNTISTVQSSDSLTLAYGVTADNPGFEKLFRAYNLVYNNPTNTAALQEASDLVQSAIDDIANVQGVLATQAKSMEEQMDKNEQDKGYLSELASSIRDIDIPSASVSLTEIQGQLEASYSASVRILNLSLVNYL